MSILLPPSGHPVREMFDVSHVAAVCAPEVRDQLPSIRQALLKAREQMAKDAGIHSVNVIVRSMNDPAIFANSITLVQIRRTSYCTLWNFTKGC